MADLDTSVLTNKLRSQYATNDLCGLRGDLPPEHLEGVLRSYPSERVVLEDTISENSVRIHPGVRAPAQTSRSNLGLASMTTSKI
mmetsp:Transcript_10683/g.44522  ORF Transcript_10683/g.44522 Transcript_10683/m.44522 type:complete len:85 (+) Transcript_10683:373-627(+)